jgi:hypothetical protein
MSTPSTAQQGSSHQTTPPQPAPPPPADEPTPTNRAARRRKGKGVDPATAADGHHGAAGGSAHARTTPQGRRINPVRRTG